MLHRSCWVVSRCPVQMPDDPVPNTLITSMSIRLVKSSSRVSWLHTSPLFSRQITCHISDSMIFVIAALHFYSLRESAWKRFRHGLDIAQSERQRISTPIWTKTTSCPLPMPSSQSYPKCKNLRAEKLLWDQENGAANRTRTGTESLQVDFKSTMSTIPS